MGTRQPRRVMATKVQALLGGKQKVWPYYTRLDPIFVLLNNLDIEPEYITTSYDYKYFSVCPSLES